MTQVKQYEPHIAVAPQDAGAIVGMMQSLSAAWARGDADTMAELYAEDATVVLPGDVYLKGRKQIGDFMAEAFAGKWKDTNVLGIPLELRSVGDGVALLISQGGAHRPDATEVSVDDAIRGIWLYRRTEEGWTIVAYENTPLRASVPIPRSTED